MLETNAHVAVVQAWCTLLRGDMEAAAPMFGSLVKATKSGYRKTFYTAFQVRRQNPPHHGSLSRVRPRERLGRRSSPQGRSDLGSGRFHKWPESYSRGEDCTQTLRSPTCRKGRVLVNVLVGYQPA